MRARENEAAGGEAQAAGRVQIGDGLICCPQYTPKPLRCQLLQCFPIQEMFNG